MQGQANSNLNAIGRRQAEDHGRLLGALGVSRAIVSPLDRARQTAEVVRRFVELETAIDDRIMEWDCGDWSGHLRTEVRQRWPDEWAALEADPYHYRGPGCENYPDMIARTRPFLDELLASATAVVAVISHGMIGRVMIGILMGFDEPKMLGFKQPNDVVYRVRFAGVDQGKAIEPRLDHFEGGQGPLEGLVAR